MNCQHAGHFYILILIAFIVIDITNAQQQPVRNFNTEPVQAGARALSLGDAYISDPYDINSFYWNPASLTHLQAYSIAANSITSWNNVILKNSAAIPFKIDDNQAVAFGIVANYLGYFHYYGADLGYSRKILPDLSVGLFVDLGYGSGRSAGMGAITGSIGILYAPSPGASYALVYKGIGSNVHYLFYGDKEVLEHTNPRRAIQIGTTFWFPSISRKPYLCLSLASEKTFGIDKLSNRLGIEIRPSSYLAVRFGLLSTQNTASGRAGFGLFINRFRLDYGIAPSVAEERLHEISISYVL